MAHAARARDWNGAGFTRSAEVSAAGSAEKVPTVMAALDLEGDQDSDLVYGRTNSMALRPSTTSGGAPGHGPRRRPARPRGADHFRGC